MIDPGTQVGLSRSHAMLQIAVVPTNAGLVAFAAYGSRRTLLDTFPSWAALGEWYESDAATRLAASEAERTAPRHYASAADPLDDLDIGDIL